MIQQSEDIGKLVLRLTLALLMLFHGVDKIGNLGGVMSILEKNGLPEFMAYLIYVGEILAPLMLIVGYRVKVAALTISLTIVAASLLVFSNSLFSLGKHGAYALEVQAFYLFVGIAVFLLGNDRFCLDSMRRR